MRGTLLGVAAACAFATTGAALAEPVTVQLKWVADTQFAGYFVAKDKGYYQDLGLDVTVKPGGPDIAPEQVLADGSADVIVDWMPAALAAREKGIPLVNIAQTFQRSGLELTCLKSTGITSPAQFPGHTLGVWFDGNEYPFLAWMAKLDIPTDGSPEGVTVLKQGFNVAPLLEKKAACISTMSYNEYWQVIEAGARPADLVVFNYSDEGVATLEDGLYALGPKLKDPKFADKLARFVAASNRGWAYAVKHPDEAVKIVLENHVSGAPSEEHQKHMMIEVAKLIATSKEPIGYLDPASYERTVRVLLSSSSRPVIYEKPEGAWTHAIYDASKAYWNPAGEQ
jgi:NitT/TauT family transport system substrate-binding protein